MDRIGIRDLRNDTSRVVKRARAGERIIVTIDGVPAAELGPLSRREGTMTRDDLIAAGLLTPRTVDPATLPPARPIPAARGAPSTDELISEDRGED
ncbi:MAG: type II toxin-antitoxin system prevent-host-death family antitoxin [Chloroflexi bacterium]|nr:type II toxin-antitoxin system prevent-host-death family antitoxin [Chloroflexota bacterium]